MSDESDVDAFDVAEFNGDASISGSSVDCFERAIKKDFFNEKSTSLKISNIESLDCHMPTDNELNNIYSEVLNGSFCNTLLFCSGDYYRIAEKLYRTPHQRKSFGLIAACSICNAKVRGSLQISSNFLNHLRVKHTEKYEEFNQRKAARYSSTNANNQSGGEMKFKLKKKTSLAEAAAAIKPVEDLSSKILNFIACTFMSPSIVEEKSFLALFKQLPVYVPSEKILRQQLHAQSLCQVESIRQNLSLISHYCATIDVWSSSKNDDQRTFFAYTCHWLDENYKRKSTLLAYRRFCNDSFRKELILLIISQCNAMYGLEDKNLVCTITNNATNWLWAFEEFGIKSEIFVAEETSGDEMNDDKTSLNDTNPLNYQNRNEQNYAAIESIKFHNVDMTPPMQQQRGCISFNLNLIASTDYISILKNYHYLCEIHMQALQCCAKLWHKYQQSSEAVVALSQQVIGTNLITPNFTQWSTVYAAISCIVMHRNDINKLCIKLKVPQFTAEHLEYLQEYCTLFEPIACALDFLQNENNLYFGYFLPTLVTVEVKLERLMTTQEKLTHLSSISEEILKKLHCRYKAYFEIDPSAYDALIAAVTCPSIKTRFLNVLQKTAKNTFTHAKLLALLERYGQEFPQIKYETTTQQEEYGTAEAATESKPTSPHSFFDFGDDNTGSHSNFMNLLKQEIVTYLADASTTFESLNKYPTIQNIFYKYNTPLPTSAPVERLLPFVDAFNSAKHQQLSDLDFQTLLLYRNSVK